MNLTNIICNDRNNNPAVMERVALQVNFLIDGKYTDPYEISAVSIFYKSKNLFPYSVLDTDTQLINTSSVSDSILMNFSNSSVFTTNTAFNASSYTGGQTASGIFRTGVGKYVAVLDGTINLSGTINFDGMNKVIKNLASTTADYIDIWTVKMAAGSESQTVINNFSLRKGGFTVVTEPIMVKSKSRLINNRINLGSKVDIKISTDIHIENTNIPDSTKNIFRDNVITSGLIEIQKLNEASNLPSKVVVSSFSDTIGLISITSDNVMILNWDTSLLSVHPQLIAGNFGSIQGIYQIRAKYSIFDETIITDPMYLTLS